MNHCFSLIDAVKNKYNFLSWLNPIERCAASTSILYRKWCHLQTLMVAVVV
jgi:hypothetical protein